MSRKPKNTQLIIHQIFLDIGKYEKIPDKWVRNMNVNKKLNRGWRHILWTDSKVNAFVNKFYPEYKKMIKGFPHKFYLIDFARYLILKKMGGVYIDLDVRCKKAIPPSALTIIGSSFTNKKAINNNVIRLSHECVSKLLDFSVSEYNRIMDNKLYLKMPTRRFFYSVSAYMFRKFVLKNKLKSDINFNEYFLDEEAGSWIGKGGIIKRSYNLKEHSGVIKDMVSPEEYKHIQDVKKSRQRIQKG